MIFLLEAYIVAVALTVLCRLLWSAEQVIEHSGPQQDNAGNPEDRYDVLQGSALLKVPKDNRNQSQANKKIDGWIGRLIAATVAIAAITVAYWRLKDSDWGTNSDITVAVFTAVLSLVALLQWRIAGRQVQQSDDTLQLMRIQQRAYVWPRSLTFSYDTIEQKLTVKMRFRNYGQTPAYSFTRYATYAFVRYDGVLLAKQPEGFQFRRTNIVTGIGSSGRSLSTMTFPAEPEILNGSHVLYVWGYCDYTDVFIQKRSFDFAGYAGGGAPLPLKGRFAMAPFSGYPSGYNGPNQIDGQS
jgi:hypothetical protein